MDVHPDKALQLVPVHVQAAIRMVFCSVPKYLCAMVHCVSAVIGEAYL